MLIKNFFKALTRFCKKKKKKKKKVEIKIKEKSIAGRRQDRKQDELSIWEPSLEHVVAWHWLATVECFQGQLYFIPDFLSEQSRLQTVENRSCFCYCTWVRCLFCPQHESNKAAFFSKFCSCQWLFFQKIPCSAESRDHSTEFIQVWSTRIHIAFLPSYQNWYRVYLNDLFISNLFPLPN